MNLELMLPLGGLPGAGAGVGFWASRPPYRRRRLRAGVLHRQPQHGGLVLAMTLVATYTSASSFIGGPGAAYKVGLWLGAAGHDPAAHRLAHPGSARQEVCHHRPPGQCGDHQRHALGPLPEPGRGDPGLRHHHPGLYRDMVVQFIGGARLLEAATGLSTSRGLPVCQLRAAHTVIGGFRAVVMTDALQGIVMLIGTRALLAGILIAGDGIAEPCPPAQEIDPKLVSPQGPTTC